MGNYFHIAAIGKLICFHYLEMFNVSTTRKNSFIRILMFAVVLSMFPLSGKIAVAGKILPFH